MALRASSTLHIHNSLNARSWDLYKATTLCGPIACMHYHHLYFPEVKTKTQRRCDLPTVIYQVVVLVFHLGLPDNHHIATPLISPGGQDLFFSQVTYLLPTTYPFVTCPISASPLG